MVRLPQLSPERVESYFREVKKSGELSVLMSALIESPWRDLAQTIQDELETEVEASIENVDTFNSASLEKSCIDDHDIPDSAVSFDSDNEVDLHRNKHSWLKRFVVTTALFFVVFLSLIFALDFLDDWNKRALIIQSAMSWLEWVLSTVEELMSWGASLIDRILSTL